MKTQDNAEVAIEWVDINSLIFYEFNNRNHSQEQIDRIANSIKEFSWTQPIVVDESNILLVGHGRLAAAQKLGLKEVPIIRKANLTEEQKKAYRILDNKLQNDSTWNFNNLELELGFLQDNGFDLAPWGLEEFDSFFAIPGIEEEDKYSKKIEAPTYTPRNDPPQLSTVYDTEKYSELVAAIETADFLSKEQKTFLLLAAARHVVFNYEKVADYYAFAPAEVQKLMEDSALVIIDLDSAIEKGFVRLAQDIDDAYEGDTDSEEE